MIRRRSEDTAVVDPRAPEYRDDYPEPDEPEPVFIAYQHGEHLVLQAEDNQLQAIAAKHPVEIEE